MRRLPVLLAALLLPANPPLIVGTAVSSTLLITQAPVRAQSAKAVAQAAKTITVRIEGATQGSGVLVKRDGSTYTVLTAWHVVSGLRPGEELDIYTPDGQKHPVEQGSIKRLGQVDMAVLSFSSDDSYEPARVGNMNSVSMGAPIYVAGFPLATSAVNQRILRFLKGDVIAKASVAITNGYQLLYSNPTLPGMSGGAVMNTQGQLVGIHGQGEVDITMSEQKRIAVKTGTNQAVPISFYSSKLLTSPQKRTNVIASSADDYLAMARSVIGQIGEEAYAIRLLDNSIRLRPTAAAYAIRSILKAQINDSSYIADYRKAKSIDPTFRLDQGMQDYIALQHDRRIRTNKLSLPCGSRQYFANSTWKSRDFSSGITSIFTLSENGSTLATRSQKTAKVGTWSFKDGTLLIRSGKEGWEEIYDISSGDCNELTGNKYYGGNRNSASYIRMNRLN